MSKLFSSIKTKIVGFTILVVVFTAIVSIFVGEKMASKEIKEVVHNYILSVAEMAYNEVEQEVITVGEEKALSADTLTEICSEIKVEGIESGYCYIVDKEGTMLYHPTAEKIGQPVSNEVVKGLVADIAKGTIAKPAVVEYEFDGATKYASYKIEPEGKFIVVISADESDALSGISTMKKVMILCGIVILILGSIIATIVVSFIVKPIAQLTSAIGRLSELDFTESPLLLKLSNRSDEIGDMGKSVHGLQQVLCETVRDIQNQSEDIHDAAGKLTTSAEETKQTTAQVEEAVNEIANGATSQAHETVDATEQILEMGELVKQTEEAVQELKSNADVMSKTSDDALNILTALANVNMQTKQAMGQIREQTIVTNASVEKIKNAVMLISNIAEETNLLSLNASIEAARAGEQGRGFAVVASEIQKLAEESNATANDIHNIITELLSEAEKSMEVSEDVMVVIEEQDRDVANTERAFKQVKSGVDISINDIQMIAGEMKKLGEVRNNVVDIVQSLSAIAEENAAATEETSASATEMTAIMEDVETNAVHLNEVAEKLKEDIAKFRV